jgi:hypothetical protein
MELGMIGLGRMPERGRLAAANSVSLEEPPGRSVVNGSK